MNCTCMSSVAEKLVRALFMVAKCRQPSVIFMDEVCYPFCNLHCEGLSSRHTWFFANSLIRSIQCHIFVEVAPILCLRELLDFVLLNTKPCAHYTYCQLWIENKYIWIENKYICINSNVQYSILLFFFFFFKRNTAYFMQICKILHIYI